MESSIREPQSLAELKGMVSNAVNRVIVPDRKLRDRFSCCNPRRLPPPCITSTLSSCLGFFGDADQEG